MLKLGTPDLTQHPPRSPYATLGGYVHLPRLIDKARAENAKKAGDYHYDCPIDGHFFRFTGIKAKAFLAAVKTRKSDSEVLAWVRAHTDRLPADIVAWSAWMRTNGPGGSQGHGWLSERIAALAKDRDDIRTFFDLLDLDDYVTFGGKG
jgi:Domain of unknown function (DUF5069)